MTATWQPMSKQPMLRDAFNCAVVIVHHCGHEGTRPRGHSSLMGALDVQVAVKRDTADNIIATVELMKDGSQGDEFASRLEMSMSGSTMTATISSCVIVPVDGQAPSRKESRKTHERCQDRARGAHEAIGECGKIPPSNHIPDGVKAVTIDQWRDYAFDAASVRRKTQEPNDWHSNAHRRHWSPESP